MRVQHVELRDGIRLVDSRYDQERSHALEALADGDAERAAVLVDLVRATSARVRAERGDDPAFARNVLVTGVPLAHVINASFAYPPGAGSGGARFNAEDFGAWYCSLEISTAQAEVEHHRARFLREGRISSAELAFTAYLADITSQGAVLARTADAPLLDPDSYAASQAFAHECLGRELPVIAYPSVRRPGGRNAAALVPHVVQRVRRGRTFAVQWAEGLFSWRRSDQPAR